MPDLGRSPVPPRKHPDILGDSRCPVIAALPFPDVEQDPAVVAGSQPEQRPHPNEPRTS